MSKCYACKVQCRRSWCPYTKKGKMKLFKGDSWEYQYIKNLKGSDRLAWDDETAHQLYPKYNHVYDKLWLGQNHTVLRTYDLEKELPTQYPVIVKPRTNFFGLGKDCYIANDRLEIEDTQGFIAQEYVKGIHHSTDYVIKNGCVIDSFTFVGIKNHYGDFNYFQSTSLRPYSVTRTIMEILRGYTGVCNVESIEGNIIEMHLRPSLQFYDICCGLVEQLPNYIKTNHWEKVEFEQTYSKVFRTRFDGIPEVLELPPKPDSVRSVQLCWKDGKKLSETDPSAFRRRYMVVNGTDLADIYDYGEKFKIKLKDR